MRLRNATIARLDLFNVAFEALRWYARGTNAKLGETADALVHRRLDPDLVIGRRDA